MKNPLSLLFVGSVNQNLTLAGRSKNLINFKAEGGAGFLYRKNETLFLKSAFLKVGDITDLKYN